VWSIEVAKGIPRICDILVSTDDPTIAEVASNAGALVPWLRPAGLATDTASSVDVCLHALKWYEGEFGNVDGLLVLQPTSPFRSRDTVLRGIELFNVYQRRPILGVSPAESHPMWCFRIEKNSIYPFLKGEGLSLRSQDLPPAYVINGVFYLIAPKDFRRSLSFYSDDMVPLIIENRQESIDIDTEWDWKIAETALSVNGIVR